MCGRPILPKHRIGVPRGILYHVSLRLIQKGPISGSEIAERIEQFSDWRPSPGSIYPMLAHMTCDGLIEPFENNDPTVKRFKITEKGLELLKDQKMYEDKLRKRQRSIRKIYWLIHLEMPEDVYDSLSTLVNALEETSIKAIDNPEVAARLIEILSKAAKFVNGIVL